MVDAEVVEAVKKYLAACRAQGLNVKFGVLYGSFVNGTAHEWSDIDLLVVAPEFDGARNRRDVDLLWHLTAQTNSRIEPIACGEKQWLADDSSAIIEIARREGQRVEIEEDKVSVKP